MSRSLVRVVLGAGICIAFAGVTRAVEEETASRPLPSADQSRILAALDEPTEFAFQARPLGEAMDYFKQKHEIQIVLANKGEVGAAVSSPINLTFKNIRLRSALRLVLRQVDLTYVVGDGYLLITSTTEAENKLGVKVYPVHDLVTHDSEFRPAPPLPDEVDRFPTNPFATTPTSTSVTGDFSGLIDMITSTIGPVTWDEVGGPGSITDNAHSQAIAVSQTDEIHEEIVVLLAALRCVRDRQIAAAKAADTARPETPEKKPLKVRAYRLLRGPKPFLKSGWRPPVGVAGDVRQPQAAQARAEKQAGPEPSGVAGAAKESAPATGTGPATGAADKGVPADPADSKLESWAETIAELVPEMIEPESWQPSGEGMIRAIGAGVVVRNTEEVHRRVARLMAELLPDCVPMDYGGPWGPWRAALQPGNGPVRLTPATTDNWPQQAEPRPSAAEARIEEALLQKGDLEFTKVPLIDVLRHIADERQVQFYIDQRGLAEVDRSTDIPVTCSLKQLSYKAALTLLLDELDLVYSIRDDVLFITGKTKADDMLSTKVYPVFDLVIGPPAAPAGPDFARLIDNMTTSIAPTSWDEVGGPGAIKEFKNSGALVISQTAAIHEEIAEYLKALREARTAQGVSR